MCDMWHDCNVINNVKKLHHFKVRFGEHFGNSYFTEKKVSVDNNENNSKIPIMLRSIFTVSNVTLQIVVQFYFFNPMNASSYLDVFVRGARRRLEKVQWCCIFEYLFITKIVFLGTSEVFLAE